MEILLNSVLNEWWQNENSGYKGVQWFMSGATTVILEHITWMHVPYVFIEKVCFLMNESPQNVFMAI